MDDFDFDRTLLNQRVKVNIKKRGNPLTNTICCGIERTKGKI
jgi:hypothetical protein